MTFTTEWPRIPSRAEANVLDALRSGRWWRNEGDWVRRFEQAFSEVEAAPHVIAVTNGTHALELGVLAAKVEPGDEVVLPALTFNSTLSAVQRAGGVPVTVDVDPQCWTLDPVAFAAAASDRTAAVIPVHYAGIPADLDTIAAGAQLVGARMVQDAAHGPGIRAGGRAIATFAGSACFSFQHSKLLPGGEGGAFVTSDAALFERALLLQNCGRLPSAPGYDHREVGSNFRMTELTGALLVAQLDDYVGLADRRRAGAALLRAKLAAVDGIALQSLPDCSSVVSHYLVQGRLVVPGSSPELRDVFVSRLRSLGLPIMPAYPPLFDLPAYSRGPKETLSKDEARERCPTAVMIAGTGFSIHHSLLLEDPETLARAAAVITDAVDSLAVRT